MSYDERSKLKLELFDMFLCREHFSINFALVSDKFTTWDNFCHPP